MRIQRIPAVLVIPAQPVLASRPPSGPDWVHEIKHDGYRIIVRRDGPTVRLYSRNANDWTKRLRAIADRAERIKAKTIDGEAVVLGPDGSSRFECAVGDTAILYAFDLIEQNNAREAFPARFFPIGDRAAVLVGASRRANVTH